MPQRYRVFFIFLVAYILSYFLRSTNAVIADDLTRELGLTASQLGFMTSLFFASFALVQLPLGSALDRFGARWITPLFMFSSVVGGIIFALAQSFAVLAIGRALIGLGTAANLTGALKSFSGWFESKRFATVSSTYLALGSTGALIATTPLAILTEQLGWRNVFLAGAVFSLLSGLAIVIWGKDAPQTVQSRASGFQGSFADIFGDMRFWRIAGLNFAIVGSTFSYQSLWAGPFLADVLGLDSVATGNLLLILSAGVTTGYLVSGVLGNRVGVPRVIVFAALIFTLIQLCLAFYSPAWPASSLPLLFASFGFTAGFGVLMFAQIRATFPLHLTGRAVTATNLFGIGGSALLQWLLGVLIDRFTPVAGVYPPQAYSAAFLATSLLCLLTLVFYLPLVKTDDLKLA